MPNVTITMKKNTVRRTIEILNEVAEDTARAQSERDEAETMAAEYLAECPTCDPDDPPE